MRLKPPPRQCGSSQDLPTPDGLIWPLTQAKLGHYSCAKVVGANLILQPRHSQR